MIILIKFFSKNNKRQNSGHLYEDDMDERLKQGFSPLEGNLFPCEIYQSLQYLRSQGCTKIALIGICFVSDIYDFIILKP